MISSSEINPLPTSFYCHAVPLACSHHQSKVSNIYQTLGWSQSVCYDLIRTYFSWCVEISFWPWSLLHLLCLSPTRAAATQWANCLDLWHLVDMSVSVCTQCKLSWLQCRNKSDSWCKTWGEKCSILNSFLNFLSLWRALQLHYLLTMFLSLYYNILQLLLFA